MPKKKAGWIWDFLRREGKSLILSLKICPTMGSAAELALELELLELVTLRLPEFGDVK